MSEDKGWILDMERQFDERAELREKVKHNANLYRRDVQYALDLMGDVREGSLELDTAIGMLEAAHEKGRDELKEP